MKDISMKYKLSIPKYYYDAQNIKINQIEKNKFAVSKDRIDELYNVI
jgi:hypothetical protein